MESLLKKKAAELGIELSDGKLQKFEKYYEMLVEKNKVMNLTAVTEYDMVVDKHFIDSLSIVKAIDMNSVKSVIDVGTGAGFPGIPLKIAFPHLDITLLDSLNKRVGFLNEVIEELELQGKFMKADHISMESTELVDEISGSIKAVHFRAEDAAHDPAYREKYDLVVSRAVADMAVLSEYCLPFVKKGGRFAAYKSGDSDEELKGAGKAIRVLGGEISKKCGFELPQTDMSRIIVIVKKNNVTPGKYPRKAGTPSKMPIR